MKKIERGELLDLAAYEQIRDQFRQRVIQEKKRRRVALGDHITVLFENRDSVLMQIQEMLRTERITAERGILHELETYNELIAPEGQLAATIFIEYTDTEERDRMLVELAGIEQRFYLSAGGERVPILAAERGERQDRTTAVLYVTVPLGTAAREAIRQGSGPVVLGVDHPSYSAEVALDRTSLESLAEDLGDQGA